MDEAWDMARAVRMARAKTGKTQRELAEGVGVSWQTVSSWERGHTEPSRKKLARLIEVAGLPRGVLQLWATGRYMSQ